MKQKQREVRNQRSRSEGGKPRSRAGEGFGCPWAWSLGGWPQRLWERLAEAETVRRGSNAGSPSVTLPQPTLACPWAWGGLAFHLGLLISSSISSRLQVWGSQGVEENIFPLLLSVVFLLSGLLSGRPSGEHSRKILKTSHLKWPPGRRVGYNPNISAWLGSPVIIPSEGLSNCAQH